MTREQEITKEAKKFAKEIDDWEIAEDVQDAFEQGAEWADRTMIDKVYDWLEFYLATAVVEWDEELTRQSFLDELMRKMKGGVG